MAYSQGFVACPPIRSLIEACPEAERPAALDHLRSLAAMSPQKRSAIMTLTRA